MNRGHLLAWLELRSKRGLDDAAMVRLVEAFGSAEAVLAASPRELEQAVGLDPAMARAVRAPLDGETRRNIAAEAQALDRGGIAVVTCLDPAYPPRLRMIPDPPPLLAMTGALQPGDELAVAVVGTRDPTPAGRLVAQQLARALASAGLTVVSGLARGVDGAAHRGALEANGRTLAVLGCGIDQTYPAQHRALRRQIEARGAVLSELPWGAAPLAHHFPRRNRIISGLSVGVLVTEAAARSGSLITARLAAEQGREVFAVPGPIHVEQSRGPNGLIKQGAKLVERVEDILEELLPQLEAPARDRLMQRIGSGVAAAAPLDGEETVVYNLLSFEPTPIDDLIVKSGLPAGTVNSLLLAMELRGLARRLPGHCSVRV